MGYGKYYIRPVQLFPQNLNFNSLAFYVPHEKERDILLLVQILLASALLTNVQDISWRSQNSEKVTHIKERLPDQAMILFNCVPFQMGTSLKGKNLLLGGANSFLYEQFHIVWKITFITLSDLP